MNACVGMRTHLGTSASAAAFFSAVGANTMAAARDSRVGSWRAASPLTEMSSSIAHNFWKSSGFLLRITRRMDVWHSVDTCSVVW